MKEREECLKGIKIHLAIEEKRINAESKLNSADLLLEAAQFVLCNGVQSSCSCWLLLFILAR